MPDDHKLTVTIDGAAGDEGFVRLNVFLNELQAFHHVLRAIEKNIATDSQSIEYRIVGLSLNSPAQVTLEAIQATRTSVDNRVAVLRTLVDSVSGIIGGNVSDVLDPDALRAIQSVAFPVGRHIRSLSATYQARTVDFSHVIVDTIDKFLQGQEKCHGEMDGTLEHINIHGGANVFSIYPRVGPRKLRCQFPSELLDDATSAIGLEVTVEGTFSYEPKSPYPRTVEVDRLEVLPRESELPDWEDLLGIAPHATGDLSSEDFVKEMRSAWE